MHEVAVRYEGEDRVTSGAKEGGTETGEIEEEDREETVDEGDRGGRLRGDG